MCLYPKYFKNPKYLPNKKNKGKPPICKDRRLLYIPAKCGCCIECRKEKQREWRVRLEEELRSNYGYFITLTISPEGIKDLEERESKRNSYKRTTVVFGKSTKRYRQEHAPLVRNGARRGQRQNTPTRYFFRTKKCRCDKKTLELRVYIYRTIL